MVTVDLPAADEPVAAPQAVATPLAAPAAPEPAAPAPAPEPAAVTEAINETVGDAVAEVVAETVTEAVAEAEAESAADAKVFDDNIQFVLFVFLVHSWTLLSWFADCFKVDAEKVVEPAAKETAQSTK